MIDAAPAVAELGWWPSDVAMRAVDGLAATTGMPYWVSIAVTTLALRTLFLPVGILTQRNSARMTLLRPEMDQLRQAMEVRATLSRPRRRPRGIRRSHPASVELRSLGCGWCRCCLEPMTRNHSRLIFCDHEVSVLPTL